MNNTLGPAEPAPINSGPSTIEVIIGLLALVLALAAVVIGVAQYIQARAAKRRQMDLEIGQTTIEMPTMTLSHTSDTDSVTSNPK
jgi:hypothetical protein